MSYLSDFEELNGGYVAFGGNPKGDKISDKGKIKTGKLDFDDVYFVNELKFNLFSVSQMCDKNNSVLFTDTECLVLSPDFKLPDESQVLLRVPRENNMYNVNLKNNVPFRDLTCLFAKATIDESNLWHRSRFTWVFFLATKDETSFILKTFITGLENQLSIKVKVIRSDNGTVFKNNDLNQFCGMKGIKKEFSVPRTLQQNGIAKRKNMTLIEAARTMLADSLLPILFWAEAVHTACYVQNRMLVTKPHNMNFYMNYDGDAAFYKKEHDFDAKKPESEVILSPSRYRDLNAEFKDCYDNSSNEVNAAAPTYGKSSFIDASQLPDDPDMPELEDITYSDDEDVVGAEADFNNFESSNPKVWVLVYLPHRKRAIGTKWVYRNKKDEKGIVIRIKARLVTQGHTQEDGIDYEEVFALVARIEAIRLFLSYASFMGFMVYQTNVKSAFLYGTVKEEVYVCQPPGFEDPDHLDKVYKVVKALYGLHQAPRTWYETLATYLQENDDIIFDATNKDLCKSFEKLMKDKFQMSSIGELIFFLGLQDNDVTRLQALVDKKKVVVTEAAIREVLRLDDAEGVDCLPNKENFADLARMGKGFSGVETPLFEGMIVGQEIEEEGDAEEHVKDVTAGDAAQGDDTAAHGEVPTVSQKPSIPSPTPPTLPPQPPQDLPSTSQVHHTPPQLPQVQQPSSPPQAQQQAADFPMREIIDEMDKDDVVALMDDKEDDKKEEEAKVVEDDQVQGRQAESKPKVAAAPSRRMKGVFVMDPEEESTTSSIIPADTKSKDKGKGIMVEEPKPLKKKQQIEMDEEYARKLHVELNKDIDWDVAIDHVKQKAKEDPAVQRYQVMKKKPQIEAQARMNMIMYLKNVMEEEKSRALQSINETLAQKAAKKRIVADEDDDVYTEATLLARKLILLVEIRYPLSRFTLDQVWNAVRLRVEEEGEMSMELLSAAKQKLMLLNSAAEGRLMMLCQVKTANDKCCF
nr:retrotransposon protein, putative, unclassified [Tanacetum cinerariifolium]